MHPPATLPGLLRAASRTFAVGIERLPADLRASVRTSYLLLRVSDYLEDNEEMPASRKTALLVRWAEALERATPDADLLHELQRASEDTPDALVARNAQLVLDALATAPAAHREAIVRHVADSTRGMARWIERGPRIETEADLDDYMHQVAGRVGWLLTDLFATHASDIRVRRDRLMPLGREFGLGLQTINVIRGLPQDLRRGWIYFPEEWAKECGLAREQVFDPANRDAALHVLRRLADKAGRHLDHAREYVTLLPRRHHRIRVFCLLPLFFAIRTLALSRGQLRVFSEEVKIGRPAVRRITRDTALRGWSNRWINTYARRLAR